MSKASKKRFCPAEKREMSSAECGEGRGSRFACPADCSFSPFASGNYSQLLELEEQVDKQCLEWLATHVADPETLKRDMQRAMAAKSPIEFHVQTVWRLFLEQDDEGHSCVQRWERGGFSGLKNDARVLLRAKMGVRVGLIEIQRVLDDECTEVMDLLAAEPQRFIVRDRGLASSVARFSTGLTWLYTLPHYHRLFGTAVLLQEVQGFEPREVVEEIVRHLGGPLEEAGMRRWLAENFVRVNTALQSVGTERRRLMFAGIDAKFGKVVYELKTPFAECVEHLGTAADVADDQLNDGERREGFAQAKAWFAVADDADVVRASAGAEPMLGRVLLGQAHWRLEAMGAAKVAVLRRKFEGHMGPRVRFTGERLDDFGKSMTDKDPKADLSLVPPRLLENPQVILLSTSRVAMPVGHKSHEEMEDDLFAAQDRAFLDDKVPALDGRTPREAARDPQLRPKLVRLMKSRVRATDERNLETGRNEDLNWMLRELGLDELISDPPPAHRVSRVLFDHGAEDAEGMDDLGVDEHEALPMDPSLPPAPRLTNRPFTHDEVQERLRAAFKTAESAAEMLDDLCDDGCTLIDDVKEVTGRLLDDQSAILLIPLLAQVWFSFAPPGTRGPNLPRAILRDAIQREMVSLLDMLKLKTPAALDQYMESGPQPALAKSVMGLAMHAAELMPKRQRPSPEKLAVLGAVLRAVIAELDRAHRRG